MEDIELRDEDGYPSQDALDIIAEWDVIKNGFDGLMQFIEPLWEYKHFGWHEFIDRERADKLVYFLSTAGWSGNESIVDAMQSNHVFWSICWRYSAIGGHYMFEVPNATV